MTHPLDLHPLRDVTAEAWNEIKKDHQPVYDELPMEFKSKLLDAATRAESGDPTVAFECRVAEKLAAKAKAAAIEAGEAPPEVVLETVQQPEETAEVVDEEPEAEPTTDDEKEHLELKGKLPEDFPSHAKLHDAGINTYGQLNKVDDLTAIEGIGPATAKAIKKRLKADAKTLNK